MAATTEPCTETARVEKYLPKQQPGKTGLELFLFLFPFLSYNSFCISLPVCFLSVALLFSYSKQCCGSGSFLTGS